MPPGPPEHVNTHFIYILKIGSMFHFLHFLCLFHPYRPKGLTSSPRNSTDGKLPAMGLIRYVIGRFGLVQSSFILIGNLPSENPLTKNLKILDFLTKLLK